MTKDYIEDECGAKFPLNYTFDGVNNFVFSTDVMFEDLQALCLGLVAKLEAAEQGLHPTSGILPDLQAWLGWFILTVVGYGLYLFGNAET